MINSYHKITLSVSFVLMLIIIASCTSPMDIDTERRYNFGEPVRLKPVLRELSIEENGTSREFTSSNILIEIDTTYDPPVIWLQCAVNANEPLGDEADRIRIIDMNYKFDSLPVNSGYQKLDATIPNSSWVRMHIQRGIGCDEEAVLYLSDNKSYAEVSFVLNKKKKELWSYLYSKIYDNKYKMMTVDSIIYVPFTKIVYDTTWIDSVTYTVSERLDTLINEVHISSETKTPYKDSMIINSKMRFTY